MPRKVVEVLGQQHGIAPRHGGIGHNQPLPVMTTDADAARGAQNTGMMVSALSINPILEVLMGRNRRKGSKADD